jgi:hypothetical protein
MTEFGRAVFVGLCIGLIWGVGCSLALLYSIFLAGYRKAVEDSLAPEKSKRFVNVADKVKARRASG